MTWVMTLSSSENSIAGLKIESIDAICEIFDQIVLNWIQWKLVFFHERLIFIPPKKLQSKKVEAE